MSPVIMNDCGSGGISSSSLGDNKRGAGIGMCYIRKKATITSAVFLIAVYISSALLSKNMNNVSSIMYSKKRVV